MLEKRNEKAGHEDCPLSQYNCVLSRTQQNDIFETAAIDIHNVVYCLL